MEPYRIPVMGPLNMRDDEFVLGAERPGTLVDLLNMDYDLNGLVTRGGYTAYGAAIAAGKPVMSTYRYAKRDGTDILLAVCGTTLWKEGGTPGVFASIRAGIVDGALWDFVTLADLCFGIDGSAADAIKYDGTTVYPMAITAPTAGPSVALSGAGALTGAYQYKVTFVSKWGGETNPGQASAPITASANQIGLSAIPIGGADVAERRLYRTLAGGSVYYLLATITNNTATVYTDNTSDINLSADPEPIDHDPPPNGHMMAVWKEYLWMVDPAHPTRIAHSHQSTPEIFNTDEALGFFVSVGLNDGEELIGIGTSKDALFAFKESSTWPITGDVPDDFKTPPEAINKSIGLHHRTIGYLADGTMVGLHRSGVYRFNGYAFSLLSDRTEDSVQKVIENLNPSRLAYARGYVDRRPGHYRYHLFITESGYSYNNKELVLDLLRDRWTVYDRAANGMVRWNDSLLLASAKNDGLIHRVGGLNDNGAAITTRAEWPWWSLWSQDAPKLVRLLRVDTTQSGQYVPMAEVFFDGAVKSVRLPLGSVALYGSPSFQMQGGTYRVKKFGKIDRADVHVMKLVISHSGLNQPITLNGLTVYGEASTRVVA